MIVYVSDHIRATVTKTGAHNTFFHDLLLDRVDVAQISACDIPFDIRCIVVVIASVPAKGRRAIRLAVYVSYGALTACEIGRGHSVVASLVHDQAAARRWVDIVVVVLVESVPPVKVILGKIRFA